MKRFGIIGNPVAHSLSPALFKAAYGGKWAYDLIEEETFPAAWNRFLEGYDAINVTAPFKQDAFFAAGRATEAANAIGAANIIFKNRGVTCSDNSDYRAVERLLEVLCPDARRALIIGCGGAGKAAAHAAASKGLQTTIANRDEKKAFEFAISHPLLDIHWAGLADAGHLAGLADVIIYTVPVPIGSLGRIFHRALGKTYIEANYKDPSFSPELIGKIRSRGGQYCSGKEWLLLQAIEGYKILTGEDPDIESMKKVFENNGY